MNSEPIPIILATDSGYCMPTAVCLTSLKQYRRPGTRYEVHLLCWELSEEDERRLLSLADAEMEIRLHASDPSRYAACTEGRHMPPATFLRLDCAELLPDSLTRALYLDGDMIIKGDLGELYATPLEGCTLAAVPDLCLEAYNRKKGISKGIYVNAGMLLMDLQRMREQGDAAALREAACRMPADWQYMDQDLLNHYYEGRIRLLPLRYNAMLPLFAEDTEAMGLPRLNTFYQTRYASMEDAYDDAAIIHYAGKLKPWMQKRTPWGGIWRLTYNRSPYATRCLRTAGWRQVRRIMLLGFLPLLKVESDARGHRAWLFGALPLWSYRCGGRQHVWLLFHCLPLLAIRQRLRR